MLQAVPIVQPCLSTLQLWDSIHHTQRTDKLSGCRRNKKRQQRGTNAASAQKASAGLAVRGRNDKGTCHPASSISIKNILGEGSFGQVFEGVLAMPDGDERVVLKRVKQRVQGACEMAEMEHVLNVYATRVARDAVADFLGFCEVADEDTRVNKRLTPGLWLIWRYEGRNTLAYYLRRRDCLAAIAADMGIPVEAVVPTVMKQLFEALSALHAAGLVHRDCKPLNVIFNEKEQRFKFIDLGAMADLRLGTNYAPNESILDPFYCAPEQYVLPTTGPDIAKMSGPLSLAMSPMIWQQHKPDRFDMYSAGLIMMQLAMQRFRTPSQLKSFNRQLAECGHDLWQWKLRFVSKLPVREFNILDANEGAGWHLAAALLRPRKIQVNKEGHVTFSAGRSGEPTRPSASEALKYDFVTKGACPTGSLYGDLDGTTSPSSSVSSYKGVFGLFRRVSEGLFDAEAKLINQASATQRQGTEVRRLRAQVAAKAAPEEQLLAAEKTYTKMSKRLETLSEEYDEEASLASKLMSKLGFLRPPVSKAKDIIESMDEPAAAVQPPVTTESGSASTRAAAAPKQRWPRQPTAQGVSESRRSPSDEPTPPRTARGGSQQRAVTTDGIVGQAAEAEDGASSAGRGLGAFATDMIYKGLKLTAVALSATTDLVVKMGKEAEVALAEAEARGAARKAAVAAFKRAMDQLPVTSSTKWGKSKAALAALEETEDGWSSVLAEKELQEVFEARVQALQEQEAKAKAAASAAFMEMLAEARVAEGVSWKLAKADLCDDARFVAVDTDRDRNKLYTRYQLQLKAEREAVEQAARREDALRQLLLEQDVQLLSAGSWVAVRKLVASDPRFSGVTLDRRRKEIFLEVVQAMKEHAAIQEAMQQAKLQKDLADAMVRGADKRTELPKVEWKTHAPAEGVEQVRSRLLLEELREKQLRLKEEYDRMEAQLEAMEQQLGARSTSSETPNPLARLQQLQQEAIAPGGVLDSVEMDDSGNIMFRFSDSDTSYDEQDALQPRAVRSQKAMM